MRSNMCPVHVVADVEEIYGEIPVSASTPQVLGLEQRSSDLISALCSVAKSFTNVSVVKHLESLMSTLFATPLPCGLRGQVLEAKVLRWKAGS